MIRLFRLLSRLGLRWVVLGAIARFVGRHLGRTTIERAADDLEARAHERLPGPVARAVSALPAEARTVGGSALVAGRTAKRAATTSRRTVRFASQGTRRVAAGLDGARSLASEVRDETDRSARQLRARYLEATVGPDAATDSLLDVASEGVGRASDSPGAGRHRGGAGIDASLDPHERVPAPVGRGRRRSRRVPTPVVNRRGRTYRRQPKAWD